MCVWCLYMLLSYATCFEYKKPYLTSIRAYIRIRCYIRIYFLTIKGGHCKSEIITSSITNLNFQGNPTKTAEVRAICIWHVLLLWKTSKICIEFVRLSSETEECALVEINTSTASVTHLSFKEICPKLMKLEPFTFGNLKISKNMVSFRKVGLINPRISFGGNQEEVLLYNTFLFSRKSAKNWWS